MKFIAELCQNHNGDFDTVCRMVDAAAESGASHVKIQHIYVRNLVYRPEFEEGLHQDGVTRAIRRPWLSDYDRLQGLGAFGRGMRKSFVEYV
jgi:Sialic acid synthase